MHILEYGDVIETGMHIFHAFGISWKTLKSERGTLMAGKEFPRVVKVAKGIPTWDPLQCEHCQSSHIQQGREPVTGVDVVQHVDKKTPSDLAG